MDGTRGRFSNIRTKFVKVIPARFSPNRFG